jgi:hypothetical protein
MLAGQTGKRILRILEHGEQGKTYFLLQLSHECEQQDVPAILLDFDQRRSGLTDYLSVAREVRRCLGDERALNICTCEDAIYRVGPLVNVQTGTGDSGGVAFGKKGDYSDAEIKEVTARDSVKVSLSHVSVGAPVAGAAEKQREDMGRAFCRDLAALSGVHPRLVLLVDTFEYASQEMCAWLERWLFDALRRELAHVILVVAGRPQCLPFFAQRRPWSDLLDPIDRFEPLRDEDIRAHYGRRGLSVSETELPLLLELARPSPARMAQVGDWLKQTRGGGQ